MHFFPLDFLAGGGGFTDRIVLSLCTTVKCYALTNSSDGLVEYRLQAFLRQGRTFQILDSANVLGHCNALRVRDWCHATENNTIRVMCLVVSK